MAAMTSMPTLPMITKALLAATPEEVAEWMAACQQVAPMPLKKSKKSKKSDDGETPHARRATNSSGPTAWNVLLAETWHEMAAEVGVFYAEFMEGVDESDEKAMKKAKKAFGEAAGAAGAGYQAAMKEASHRKSQIEGTEPKPAKAKAKAKEEQTPAPTLSEDEKLAKKLGMSLKTVDDVPYLVDVSGNAFWLSDDNKSKGERAGLFLEESEEIDFGQ